MKVIICRWDWIIKEYILLQSKTEKITKGVCGLFIYFPLDIYIYMRTVMKWTDNSMGYGELLCLNAIECDWVSFQLKSANEIQQKFKLHTICRPFPSTEIPALLRFGVLLGLAE